MDHNPDLKKFLRSAAEFEDMIPGDFDPGMYRPYSIEEIYMTVFENNWLYMDIGMFFIWANEEMNNKGNGSSTRKANNKKARQKA